jgi:pseudouridine-5'-phosphate glycosidase
VLEVLHVSPPAAQPSVTFDTHELPAHCFRSSYFRSLTTVRVASLWNSVQFVSMKKPRANIEVCFSAA